MPTTPHFDERRADELKKGDLLELRGDTYVVLKAKQHGKHVVLTIDGRRGSFTDEVKGKTRYRVVVLATDARKVKRARSQVPGPLHSPSGAQARWATESEHERSLEAPAEPKRSTSWDEPAGKAEKAIVAELGAKLGGVEVEGGKLIVPPVTDTTLFGHLLTMHRVRYDGVTFEEAKAWAKANDPAGPATAEETMTALSFQKATEIHDELHRNFATLPVPHWHREKAPR